MAGVITNVETIRPSKIRTRSLRAGEMADLNELCNGFLRMYGLKLGSVVKESLIPVASHPRSKTGILQKDLRYAIPLLHAVGSTAVCASGLGLGKSDVTKRMVDRSASGVQGVGLHEILKTSGNAVAVIAAVVAVIFFLFNAVGIPGYPGIYDKFLLSVSLIMNAMVVWFAWRWV